MVASDLQGKNVSVVGAGGVTGRALVGFLSRSGVKVTAFDRRREEDLPDELRKNRGDRVRLCAGVSEPQGLDAYDLVLLTPGVPIGNDCFKKARERLVPIWSEIELASRLISAPIIAVTGTNGKSTTTSLITLMLKTWGKQVFGGGNLGDPLISAVGLPLDYVVAEISSFQLEAVDEFRPSVGILLNITPNHLDRHGSMEVYAETKARLFARMGANDRAIINSDDPSARSLAARVEAPIWFFSQSDAKADVRLDEQGILLPSGDRIALTHFSLSGRHNRENAIAAAAAAFAVGCPPSVIEKTLGTFRGLAHRLEDLGTHRGVRFVNDSKSTTPEASVRALEALEPPIVLLAGGRSKGAAYEPLARAAKRLARTTILFGEASEDMARAFHGVPNEISTGLGNAFARAVSHVKPGDTVLLSPANSSFDEFSGFEERGERFRSLVSSWSSET